MTTSISALRSCSHIGVLLACLAAGPTRGAISTPATTEADAAKAAVPSQPEKGDPLRAARAGLDVERLKNFVRAYEPNELGLTWDQKEKGHEKFMEFKFSLMFPLIGRYADQADPEKAPWKSLGPFDTQQAGLFLSATIRGGQYIWTRKSAPVVEKRFNPQLFTRFWFVKDVMGIKPSPNSYLDLILYGHESNGQAIIKEERFADQREVYRKLEEEPTSQAALDSSWLSARDTISRGWDYFGLELSVGWPSTIPVKAKDGKKKDVTISHVARLKARQFLKYGRLLQKGAEEYNSWEGDGPEHHRANYDGLMLQYSSALESVANHVPVFTGGYTVTYTTGLAAPLRHSTIEIELDASLLQRPFSLWYRRGYNSDLTDYYKLSQSFGAKISIKKF